MRAVVQRVQRAQVEVDSRIVGQIGSGLMVLLGVGASDDQKSVDYLSEKICNLRVFEDELGKMNRSLIETQGAILVVSQFTLYGDCRKGRRPSFIEAAPPELAKSLYESFCNSVRSLGVPVETGIFQADMLVTLANDGPVTLILEG